MADWFAPASEAAANGTEYRIALELPGVAEDDIDVSMHDGVVTVSGKKTSEREEEGETWFFSERAYGSFSRSFRLPPDAEADGVEAELSEGLLTIRVPKRDAGPAGGARKVQIKAGERAAQAKEGGKEGSKSGKKAPKSKSAASASDSP
ncbi:MAG: Hsp20/alpha crystallin family protein [Roseicyclus sp.]